MSDPGTDRRKWWILYAMSGSGGLILLDETVIGVALPTIQHDIGMSLVVSHWVINAYLLTFAGFAAAGGKMGDVVGMARTFFVGLAAFGLGSLAAGFAESETWLIAARAVQGLGAAVIFPATISIVSAVFPQNQRGMAIGIMIAVANIFLAAGPFVGGSLIALLSWRWIFWMNVPIVVFVALTVATAWPGQARKDEKPRIDFTGVLMLAAGLGLFVFAIMQGAAWGWTQAGILGPLVGGLIVIAGFVVVEWRRDNPLIEIALFRNKPFAAYNAAVFAGQFSKMAVIVFGALYLQHILQMSPFTAGLCMLAAVVGTPLLAALSGRLVDKLGPRGPSLLGLACVTLGLVWIGVAAAWDSYPLLLPGLVLWGAALPACFTGPLRAVMSTVPAEKQGQASGISMTMRLLGATIGMAACSTLYATTESYQVVFLATAAFLAVVLVYTWLATGRSDAPAQGSPR
jgi:EmrB/QacA subfamily drug resistance transporter